MTNERQMDSLRMDRVLLSFPDQILKGWELAQWAGRAARGCRRVVIAGMGGSALPGELLMGYLRQQCHSALPVEVTRDYWLPPGMDAGTLVIAASFSGNTEETLAAYGEAGESGAQRVAVAAGGKLLDLAQADRVPSVRLPVPWAGFQPRCSLGYVFGALLRILDNAGLLPTDPAVLEQIASFLRESQAQLQVEGQRLAGRLQDRIVLVYAPERFGAAVARTFKIKLNENAKTLAFWNALPELNHNEMIGFESRGENLAVLLLEHPDCHPRIQRRCAILAEMLAARSVRVERIALSGSSYLQSCFWGILLGDWTSYHLALLRGIDPSPVELIEEFKRRLAM